MFINIGSLVVTKHTIIGTVDKLECLGSVRCNIYIYVLSMYLPISFVVSLKLPENMKSVLKDPK